MATEGARKIRAMGRIAVEKLEIPEGKRVLVISDVHAKLGHLMNLLRRANYDSTRDKLILLGDMMEKGEDSLTFLRFLHAFQKGRDLTIIRGNCDHLVLETAYGAWGAAWAWHYMSVRPESVLWQLGREMNYVPRREEDMTQFATRLRRNFPKELAFINSWPVIGETERAIFVHGGIERDENLESYEAHKCMKNDNFMLSNPKLKRWCVVGHTPTTLYHPDHPCAEPMVNREKKILSIDGGCAIKPDGQLNCVIFPSWGEERMEAVFYDDLEPVTALDDQVESLESRNIHWGEHQIRLLEEGEEFSLCEQVCTGYEMWIPTNLIYRRGGVVFTQDATDYLLPVTRGDTLKIVQKTSRGLLAKKGSDTGWYLGRWE